MQVIRKTSQFGAVMVFWTREAHIKWLKQFFLLLFSLLNPSYHLLLCRLHRLIYINFTSLSSPSLLSISHPIRILLYSHSPSLSFHFSFLSLPPSSSPSLHSFTAHILVPAQCPTQQNKTKSCCWIMEGLLSKRQAVNSNRIFSHCFRLIIV
jgi:hypothetical protein